MSAYSTYFKSYYHTTYNKSLLIYLYTVVNIHIFYKYFVFVEYYSDMTLYLFILFTITC